MIVRADTGTSFLIEFPSGHPDGNISWKLRSPDQSVLATGTITVAADAVSANLPVAAIYNSLPLGLLNTYRDLEWSYSVAGIVVNGEQRYQIEGRVPFGAGPAGVRTKLGIDDPVDLPDNEISLVSAYLTFVGAVNADALAAANPADYKIRDAIEALAALALVPTLSVRIAKKEDSGTSSFQRGDIDWTAMAGYLTDLVTAGYIVLDPNYDPTQSFAGVPIFVLASPATDPFTGEANG